MRPTQKNQKKYLICDFDNTFNNIDFFRSALYKLAIQQPQKLLLCILQSRLNWVKFKEKVLLAFPQDSYTLSVNPTVHLFLKDNRTHYHKIILVSATPQSFLDRLPMLNLYFDEIYGSTNVNLKGGNKLNFILTNSLIPFDYIGDSDSDRIIFRRAIQGYLCKKDKLIKQ